jgi:mono/diheme cytochrome c family protein
MLFASPLALRAISTAAVALFACSRLNPAVADDPASAEFFESKIRPVLVQHCFQCHAADAKIVRGGLLLDTAESLRRGGDSGAVIVPGNSSESLLIQALRYEAGEMPPSGRLPKSVVDDFAAWVDAGAPDPRTGGTAPTRPVIDLAAGRRFWSFIPPALPALPQLPDTSRVQTPIDQFIFAAHAARGLTAVQPADRRELIRRATFDLLGLPPQPADVAAFLADSSPDAFTKVVDRLLASPHYGERWGRYWLDVARYSEDQAHTFSVTPNTNGFRYRDWVIDAFNRDLPFDEFVRQQIAADLLPADPEQRLQNLPALGYFGLGAQYYKNTDAAKAAADELDDRIDTLTRGFLGLTVSCARCHDHKFDPIPQQDYYSLAGIFRSSRLHNAPLVPDAKVQEHQQAQQRLKDMEQQLQKLLTDAAPRARERRLAESSRYLQAAWIIRRPAAANEAAFTVDKVAAAWQLDNGILKRWLEFLSSGESAHPLFRAWFDSLQSPVAANIGTLAADVPSAVPEAAVVAADAVQRHLQLLQKSRSGSLTAAEEQELQQHTPAGNARWTSPVVNRSRPSIAIDLDLTGASQLHLVVTDGGNGASCDHADWALPVLVTTSGEVRLTSLKWRSATASYGSINIDRNVNGNPLRIGGTPQEFGIGTHSTSHIVYDLPPGTLRFRGTAGLDNSGTDQGGDCGANATVQFRIYTEPPADLQTTQTDLLAQIAGEKGVYAIDPAKLEEHLEAAEREELAKRRTELEQARKDAPGMYPIAHVIVDAQPADMKVFLRGNPANEGEVAPRRFLRVLAGDDPPQFRDGSGRLQLAQAIASPQNPLTARVIVNRIWQQHFGRGLVGTPDNFGKLGEQPSHPELLDYLAVRFIESGWSLKWLHREILLSATWQLSSTRTAANEEQDADNRYLWRANRRRLDVEAWRDALLAVSGRLNPQFGGPSTSLADAGNVRRTVYAFISRHELDNMLRLFDFPDANITSATRAETTVPQQQLFVLNSPFMLNQARAFAARLQREAGDDPAARIRLAFQLAFSRDPSAAELQLGLDYMAAADSGDQPQNSLNRWERYAQILLAANEFLYID